MSNIERRVSDLEKRLAYLVKNISKDKTYTGYDIEAGRTNTSNVQKKADDNATEILKTNENLSDTQDAICEQSMISEQGISDIENAMCESELLTDARITEIEDAICELSINQSKLESEENYNG